MARALFHVMSAPPSAQRSQGRRTRWLRRACELIFVVTSDVDSEREATRRRRPQRPGRKGGFWKGGRRPPLLFHAVRIRRTTFGPATDKINSAPTAVLCASG